MTDLIVRIAGASWRLARDRTWYLVADPKGLRLTPVPGAPQRLGFFTHLLNGWYFRTDDAGSSTVHLNGRPVQRGTPMHATDAVEVTVTRAAGTGVAVRQSHRSGYDEDALARALQLACPQYEDLERLLAVDLGVELYDITPPGDMRWVNDFVVRTARAFGWLTELLTAVRFAHPEDTDLDYVIPRFDRESIVDEVNGLFDPQRFASDLLRNCARVCRIKVSAPGQQTLGTGFLVGPDLVLTNHHVLEGGLSGKVPPSGVTFKFDFHTQSDFSINPTAPYGLSTDWRIADSPPSSADFDPSPVGLPEPTDELDYALVRLNGSPGTDELEIGERRGWLHLLDTGADPRPGEQLFIPQHPNGLPLRAAIGEIVNTNQGMTRLTHQVNTMKGSSGSPCFSLRFDLIAMHHAGSAEFAPAPRNAAIPVRAITDHLKSRGVRFEPPAID
jgi:hypothetical protein